MKGAKKNAMGWSAGRGLWSVSESKKNYLQALVQCLRHVEEKHLVNSLSESHQQGGKTRLNISQ